MSSFITPIQPIESINPSSLTGVSKTNEAGSVFDDILESAMKNIESVQAASDADATNLALGNVDDLAQVQINSMKAETMIQTTVQVTSRVVSAYKEIMQMQV